MFFDRIWYELRIMGRWVILISTHIVEDIAQTCQNLTIMKGGHIIFHGTVADLLREALGKVWIITTQGNKPEGNITVVSTLKMGSSVQYRVVGELSASAGAILAEPNLEDSYVWLMREQSIPIRAST